MNAIERQTVRRLHTFLLNEAGNNNAQIQGWTTEAEQQIRYDIILSLADFNGASILDVGCGYGDFKARLDEEYHNVEYIGLDQQAVFIESAQQKYEGQENTWFHEVDFSSCKLPKVDLVIACGVLSYYSTDPNFYFYMIQRFYEAAGKALIFNLMDEKYFNSGPIIVAHDKEKIYRQCLELCPNTILTTGYVENDFTIRMEKT